MLLNVLKLFHKVIVIASHCYQCKQQSLSGNCRVGCHCVAFSPCFITGSDVMRKLADHNNTSTVPNNDEGNA